MDMQECIRNCLDCHRACLETMSYCLEQGGKHTDKDHILLMSDCAEICQTSANFMIRGSARHTLTCATCAEVCDRCAEDCSLFSDDHSMQRCADLCRRCADSCRRMAA